MSVISYQKLSKGELTQLLDIAREAIRGHLSNGEIKAPQLDLYSKKLLEPAACFVTLEVNGELQGCLGTIAAHSPLVLEVHNKARASAYQDHRFMPLTKDQLDKLTIEVSVLSEPERLEVNSEQELLDYLADNKVGVILTKNHKQALFLPQVWEKLPKPIDFIRQLKVKAGWNAAYWSADMVVSTFTVSSIKGKYF
ncbi:AmmeMemoRadiSam system protein A [Photobacterium lipolyticum]|uniref:AmmeMemoRadiSam system protein A n=1 Tax=Photobacterium lipolyticum TaxID=266810 RepID=A0A2T3N0R0_9GAMM|nr:AmmeMemoRadiSam system protein A [Photobacterium lipolyticum]PSW05736.1 AmmeMemoRadiSam system protein A [Photobacterium lipolyticum]